MGFGKISQVRVVTNACHGLIRRNPKFRILIDTLRKASLRLFLTGALFSLAFNLVAHAQSWVQILPRPTSNWTHGIHFIDYYTGWTVGDGGEILKTTDRGNSWTSLNSGVSTVLSDIQFIDKNTGWIAGGAGNQGLILKTTNGGTTWATKTSLTTPLTSIYFVSPSLGWAVGSNGVILKTTDGGETWSTKVSGTTNFLKSVFFIDSNNGWVGGFTSTLLKTTDGGNTWAPQTSGLDGDVTSVFFINSSTGLMTELGGTLNNPKSIIKRSTNGGASWSDLAEYPDFDLYSVAFAGASDGWVVGSGGNIVRSSDGGVSWGIPQTPVTSQLDQVFAQVNAGVWSIGTGGTIIRAADQSIQVTVFLEGAYTTSSDNMRTDLRNGNFGDLGASPFGTVDTVTVELRNASTPASVVASQKAYLRSDGRITDFGGQPQLSFPTVVAANYYVVVKHRNHLSVMSSAIIGISSGGLGSWNFTTALSQAYLSGQKQINSSPSRFGMVAGDATGNGQVQNSDINNVIRLTIGQSGYRAGDTNLNGQVQNSDLNLFCRPNIGRGTLVP